jgi:zinc resistance-associated protein
MKRLAMILGSVLVLGVIAVPVLARGPGWGKGSQSVGSWWGNPGFCWQYGRGYDKLTEEQRTQLDKLHQKFYDETAQLKTGIWAKRAELRILLNTSNPDVEKAKALQKEVSDLMGKLAQERLNFLLEARKIDPNLRFGMGFGREYGRHMRGYGPHMGFYGPGMDYGPPMGGYGPGMGYGPHMGFYGHGMGYGPGMGPGQYPGGYGPGYYWR